MIEQRLPVRMIAHWNMIRKERVFPDIQHFNNGPIEDLWQNCLRVKLGVGEVSYKYEYMGKNLIDAYGRDLTGQTIDQNIRTFPGSIMYKSLGEVLLHQAPHEDRGHLLNAGGKLLKYRACFLPFGTSERQVTHIIGGISFRLF